MDKKYRLMSDAYIIIDDVRYHRIKALREIKNPFRKVRAGEIGGFVRTADNLSEYDTCWVFDNACVKGKARLVGHAVVYEEATVHGNALVSGHARVHGHAIVYGNARLRDHCEVANAAQVYGDAVIADDARVLENGRVYDKAIVCDRAVVRNFAHAAGTVILCGRYQLEWGKKTEGQLGMMRRANHVDRQI